MSGCIDFNGAPPNAVTGGAIGKGRENADFHFGGSGFPGGGNGNTGHGGEDAEGGGGGSGHHGIGQGGAQGKGEDIDEGGKIHNCAGQHIVGGDWGTFGDDEEGAGGGAKGHTLETGSEGHKFSHGFSVFWGG